MAEENRGPEWLQRKREEMVKMVAEKPVALERVDKAIGHIQKQVDAELSKTSPDEDDNKLADVVLALLQVLRAEIDTTGINQMTLVCISSSFIRATANMLTPTARQMLATSVHDDMKAISASAAGEALNNLFKSLLDPNGGNDDTDCE